MVIFVIGWSVAITSAATFAAAGSMSGRKTKKFKKILLYF